MAAIAAAIGAVSLAFGAGPARADNIVFNQWYAAGFFDPAPSALTSPGPAFGSLINGPVLPGGFADAITAPAGTSWTITTTSGGTLTVTDVERTGDQFQLFDNGVAMNVAASPFTAAGQNPGQTALPGGFTSIPTPNVNFDGGDINVSLGDPNMSSGAFALQPGVNVITGTWLEAGNQGSGDFAFIAEAATAPGPAPGAGLLGLATLLLYARARALRG
ncbi:hypothetical protein DSM21852_23650 [Methylocystis bryophila]|uniref:PEP-CTERM protein-sorting domain-containing protein n=1 Tax=Methylocystis bryophila TaxID=655015 RepID=A0A1W6MZ38_9HYPH|nr:hypothetical protein B1812_19170 [Methylocystis bryophila]BDV39112.1 hypothetical protein DSM21852_23650 [Methylocystis bryophila]